MKTHQISEDTLKTLIGQVEDMMEMIKEKPLYKAELAEKLEVSERTIHRRIKEGVITPNYSGKTQVFYLSKVKTELGI